MKKKTELEKVTGNNLTELISNSLIKVLREFGPIGVVTFVGGFVILAGFLFATDFQQQLLFGVVGLLLLYLSSFIAYFRIKVERDREQALIDMVKNSGNRLAEQVAKNLSDEQVAAIIQKIRQIQNDLISAIIQKDTLEFHGKKNR